MRLHLQCYDGTEDDSTFMHMKPDVCKGRQQRNAASKGLFQRLFPARTRLFPVLECQDEPAFSPSLLSLQPQGQKTNKANEVICLSALREAFSFPDRAGREENVHVSVCVFERVSHSKAKG